MTYNLSDSFHTGLGRNFFCDESEVAPTLAVVCTVPVSSRIEKHNTKLTNIHQLYDRQGRH